jgi:2,4-dienoyl-CoA reductase-like NADH-dependent reductase (Old Yellow Enzyme family)
MGIYDDSFIDEYRPFTAAVKVHACRIVLQVSCSGAQTSASTAGRLVWGPSRVADLATGIVPAEMSGDDIRFLQGAFAAAARRAQAAGFDGVQIHAAHGYLLSKFLNPYYNRRSDEYGGNPGNRARMLVETYAAMRAAVGEGYPLLIKINCQDFMTGGMTFEECRRLCRQLDDVGVAAFEVSGGCLSSPDNCGPIRTDVGLHPSYFKEYAADIARLVRAPVILVGGNRDFASLTRLINSSAIRFISLCRPLICQPDLVRRWRAGDHRQPRCTSCNKCLGLARTRCIFNPQDNGG